ncbi:efflux RND transporter periplasmic adaptor subunit [Aquirhabdus parva]|uniref:Efflux RND transporter periplasmic adaptor subunit n=1 Tax=Aquirhabdus parva TaxID=2283318 RepID=A0A345P766_9GAMM|nr:efflux RND transporter periplasmic adaptor subunit [Aquirhabdus parva]AXI03125.1 efflux RND transporter periplasmic adaptor subunit [Aquirhabdus parva]
MNIRAFIHSIYNSLITKKTALMLSSVVVAVLIAVWIINPNAKASSPAKATADEPMFTHKGDQIIVAKDSPLQSRLVVTPVSDAASSNVITVPGVVEANPASTVNILSPLTGRLVALHVKLGDVVKKGQVLAVISSPDLAQAQTDAVKAKDALDLANRTLVRAKGINSIGANATKDIEAAESGRVQAQAEYERAQARLTTLGSNTHDKGSQSALLTITAPTSGAVTALNVGSGAYLNDSTAALMTISNLDRIWVSANIPEDLSANIRQGLSADVTLPAYPDQTFHGTIDSVSAVLDADTRRSKARISFANTDGKLKPNMFAAVKIAIAAQKQLSVPPSALLMNNDDTTVFVEVQPGVYKRRVVELGVEDANRVQILSGLTAGDRIVIRGGVLLND